MTHPIPYGSTVSRMEITSLGLLQNISHSSTHKHDVEELKKKYVKYRQENFKVILKSIAK